MSNPIRNVNHRSSLPLKLGTSPPAPFHHVLSLQDKLCACKQSGHLNHSFIHAGSLCSSGHQQLASSNADAFSRGSTDEFALHLRHMGQLQELHIWHNGTGLATAWRLSLIVIADETNGDR